MNNETMATCGMQVCSHPVCWEETKRFFRRMNKPQPHKQEPVKVEESPKTTCNGSIDDIPTLSIWNMLEDYGYSYVPEFPAITRPASGKPSKNAKRLTNIPTEGSEIITKLKLHTLTQASSSGITPAPANTPLQSSHGFGDTARCSEESATSLFFHAKRNEQQVFQSNIHNIALDRHLKKKYCVWRQAPTRKAAEDHPGADIVRAKTSPSNLLLPADIIPSYNTQSTWKLTKLKKSQKDLLRKHKTSLNKLTKSVSNKASPEELGISPVSKPHDEIEKLRHVPVDVLLRVVKMAMRNKVLTSQQARFLLEQVTGQTDLLPERKSHVTRGTCSLSTRGTRKPVQAHPSSEALQRSVPVSSSGYIVYKLDTEQPENDMKSMMARSEAIVSPTKKVEMVDKATQQSSDGVEQRSPSFHKMEPVAIKSRVGLFPNALEEAEEEAPKPFHYEQPAQNMRLNPLPTPPPPTPSTERDSKYDDVLGGSTVMVNLSDTQSRMSQERPPSAGSRGSSFTRISNAMTDGKGVSSTKSTAWPQVDENNYMSDSEELVAVDLTESYRKMNTTEMNDQNINKLPALVETATVASNDEPNPLEASPVPPPPSPVAPPSEDIPLDKPAEREEGEGIDDAT